MSDNGQRHVYLSSNMTTAYMVDCFCTKFKVLGATCRYKRVYMIVVWYHRTRFTYWCSGEGSCNCYIQLALVDVSIPYLLFYPPSYATASTSMIFYVGLRSVPSLGAGGGCRTRWVYTIVLLFYHIVTLGYYLESEP